MSFADKELLKVGHDYCFLTRSAGCYLCEWLNTFFCVRGCFLYFNLLKPTRIKYGKKAQEIF